MKKVNECYVVKLSLTYYGRGRIVCTVFSIKVQIQSRNICGGGGGIVFLKLELGYSKNI